MNDAPSTDYRRQEGDQQVDPFQGRRGTSTSRSNAKTNEDEGDGLLIQQQHGEVLLLDIYETRQKYGYFSIAFSVVQTLILGAMMYECGIAPIRINPMIGPYPDALSYWGAKNAALILEDGETWRLFTPMLLHAGIIHLVGNVSVQIETGVFFEREWGSLVWLIIYVVSTLGSSILSTCLMPGSLSVGSSGAVMGIFGAKLSEIFCRSCEPRDTVQERVGHAIRKHQLVLALGGVVIVMLFSFIPFVDWAAHLGGMLAGIAVGLMIFACHIRSRIWRVLWFVVGLALTVTGFGVSLRYMYNEVEVVEQLRDVCGYYQQFFEDYECSCTLDGGD
jgi:membrane associated rhomboid family serine protease